MNKKHNNKSKHLLTLNQKFRVVSHPLRGDKHWNTCALRDCNTDIFLFSIISLSQVQLLNPHFRDLSRFPISYRSSFVNYWINVYGTSNKINRILIHCGEY